jgi:multidrug efflux pump
LPDIAMRVWLRPDRMAQMSISVQEVANAIQSQNQTFGIGQIGGALGAGNQQTFVITAQGLLTKPDEFEDIIIRAAKQGTASVRLRDVGRVELDKRDYSIISRMNGKLSTTIAIYQQRANAVATASTCATDNRAKQQFTASTSHRARHQSFRWFDRKVLHTFFGPWCWCCWSCSCSCGRCGPIIPILTQCRCRSSAPSCVMHLLGSRSTC